MLVDTLLYPEETAQLARHANRMCEAGIRYVINTQAAMDHSLGSSMFPEALLLAHRETRHYLAGNGARNLRRAKSDLPALESARVRLPTMTFDDIMVVRLENKSVQILHAPGPTNDTCMVYVPEEKVLFAGDLMMHIPLVTHQRCDIEAYKRSLCRLRDFHIEVIVQGHGDILLKGEIAEGIDKAVNYLIDVEAMILEIHARGGKLAEAQARGPETFGISTLPMGGIIPGFHQQNIQHLWKHHDPRLQRKRKGHIAPEAAEA